MDSYDVLSVITWVLVAIYVAVVVLYLRAEKTNEGESGFRRATTLKVICSCLFVLIAIVSYNMSLQSFAIRPDVYFLAQALVVAGLVLCIPGDYFLQYIRLDEKRYKIGIICFLGAQLLFLISLTLVNLLTGWLPTVIAAACILVAVGILMAVQKWNLQTEKVLITVYTMVLSFVAGKALAGIFSDRTGNSLIMFFGAALFLISDILLGIWNYGHKEHKWASANWITYFSGTLLIALSVNPIFDFEWMSGPVFG